MNVLTDGVCRLFMGKNIWTASKTGTSYLAKVAVALLPNAEEVQVSAAPRELFDHQGLRMMLGDSLPRRAGGRRPHCTCSFFAHSFRDSLP